MQSARAFVFAAEEDFGIIPVEAQACGTPVIAFGKGGALETVRPLGIEEPTGIFFKEQNIASLHEAVSEFEKMHHFLHLRLVEKMQKNFLDQDLNKNLRTLLMKSGIFSKQNRLLNVNYGLLNV